MTTNELRDEFLSEEDLSLKELTEEELFAYWELWLLQAQATNDLDAQSYSHGVFEKEPLGKGSQSGSSQDSSEGGPSRES